MSISQSEWDKTLQQIRARFASTLPPVRYPQTGKVLGVKAGLSLVALSPEPLAGTTLVGHECYNSSGTKIAGTMDLKVVWSAMQEAADRSPAGNGETNTTFRILPSSTNLRLAVSKVAWIIACSNEGAATIKWAYIAERDGGDARDIVDGTKVDLWTSPKTGNAYEVLSSGLVDFPIDTAKNYSITFFIDGVSQDFVECVAAGNISYSIASEETTLDWSGLGPTACAKCYGYLIGV